jgi:hypothetical protein
MRAFALVFAFDRGVYTMTRRGFLTIAMLAFTYLLVGGATPTGVQAQEYRARHTAGTVRAPIGNASMAAPNAPRAGSIDRRTSAPAYQQPPGEPATRDFAARQSRSAQTPDDDRPPAYPAAGANRAATSEQYFDPRASNRQSARAHATVNRAAYQETETINGIANTEEIVAPVAAPEDLPTPGVADSMPMMEPMPYGPLRFRDGSVGYGPGSGHDAECGCGSADCGGDCGGCGAGPCAGDCGVCDTCPDWYPGKDLTLFVGPHAFSGASDPAQQGSFGFHEGVNWSSPFWNAAGVGFQLGFQAMQSDFTGGDFFDNQRSQYFITTGFFRRQMCEYGWQWGVVYDFLSDQFEDDFDVSQIRGELSYRFRGHELGFWFASNASDDLPELDSTTGVTGFETVDQYNIFYRRRLRSGGEGRLWGGVTGESDGIFGGDVRVPLASDWDLVAAFNYLSAGDDSQNSQLSDAWNIGINLVWYVCPDGALKACGSRYRPLFNVADNGTLVTSVVR